MAVSMSTSRLRAKHFFTRDTAMGPRRMSFLTNSSALLCKPAGSTTTLTKEIAKILQRGIIHEANVRPRAEGAPRSGDDQGPDRVVISRIFSGQPETAHHFCGQGVESVGPI